MLIQRDPELRAHEVIRKYKAELNYLTYRRVRDFGVSILVIKFISAMAHTRRSLALSAPRNTFTALVKYLLVPTIIVSYSERERSKELMAQCDDLKDP